MSVFHSLLYVAFLVSVTQCQTTLSQTEISKILQLIQNQPGGQPGAQSNNAETVQLIQKLMASSQGGNQSPQTNFQPQQPNFQPQQPNFQPQQTNFQPQQTNFQPQQPQAPVAPQPQPTNTPPPQSNSLLLPLAITGAIDNPLTALAATSMTGGNQRGAGGPNLNGYLTARAFDFNDFTTNMMLFNGLNGQQQRPSTQAPPAGNQPTQTTQSSNGGLFGHSPMGNYITARAFDFPDMYTNMMLYNGVSGRPSQPRSQQQMGSQNQVQPAFDPTLFYLTAL